MITFHVKMDLWKKILDGICNIYIKHEICSEYKVFNYVFIHNNILSGTIAPYKSFIHFQALKRCYIR